MGLGTPVLRWLLGRRLVQGKEDPARLRERMGEPSRNRPPGPLAWIHAASVGEAVSSLILIETLLDNYPGLHILVTTGTRTSANLMAKRLPARAFHQYTPIDHPAWVKNFLNHWTPDAALWMESELWPNMLCEIKNRAIPAALINARLSDKSFKRWSSLKGLIKKILSAFSLILTQTENDKNRYKKLGAHNVITSDNLKYSASPLPYNEKDLNALKGEIAGRRLWLYASTHDGEEELAARIHKKLQGDYPDLLTILVPRHPERGEEIENALRKTGFITAKRGANKTLPTPDTEIYIADTMGEMGLFYKAVDIALVGRCFSKDGGGGHNLIESAQLGCAVLTGPNVQFQIQVLNDMLEDEAIIQVTSEDALEAALRKLFDDPAYLQSCQDKAARFARKKGDIIGFVMNELQPVLASIPTLKNKVA